MLFGVSNLFEGRHSNKLYWWNKTNAHARMRDKCNTNECERSYFSLSFIPFNTVFAFIAVTTF